jgi:uncharacterized membrane-anchored protein
MDPQVYTQVFSIIMIIALGLIAGSGAGLIIGYVIGVQKTEWSDMTRRQKVINILLVIMCSIIAIAALGWYAGLP